MDNESKIILVSLLKNSKIASLGTCKNNQPFVSTVAYSTAFDFSEFYILISQLAVHTKNIIENNKVSLMICQSENESKNPNSLSRVTLTGKASVAKISDDNYSIIRQNYLDKNPLSEMLFNLGDFKIFKIEIDQARFIGGFAKTFNLSKKSLESLTK